MAKFTRVHMDKWLADRRTKRRAVIAVHNGRPVEVVREASKGYVLVRYEDGTQNTVPRTDVHENP